MTTATAKSKTKRGRRDDVPLLEWIAGGIGLFIVAGTLAFIGYELYLGQPDLPDLRIEVERAISRSDGHSVRVVVRNAGRRAAESVIVEGVAGEVRSEAQLDYVAGQSQETAILVFPGGADPASLTVRIVGYTTP
jgi:uncharacterized protein (TIGR02588 family)